MPSGCCDYHGMFTIAHPYQKFHLAGCWIPVLFGCCLSWTAVLSGGLQPSFLNLLVSFRREQHNNDFSDVTVLLLPMFVFSSVCLK